MLNKDRGATAITVAISMVVLLGMAAIAIDLGLGFNERRLDQSTADTAVLSAGVELIVSGDVQLAVNSVMSFVSSNLDRPVTTADWLACADGQALAFPSDTIPGVVNGSNCISFGPNDDGVAFGKIRVRVPQQTTPATFSRLLGSAGLITDASAEAQLDGFGGPSGAFPSGLLSGALLGNSFCIKTGNGSANQQSCGAPTTGDFGNFVPYFYTEINAGNPKSECTSGNQPAPLSRIIADGLDHFLGAAASSPGTKVNGSNCPQFPGPLFPDRLDPGSGYSNSDVTDGLILGGNYDGAFSGRLTREIWSGYGTATVFGEDLDNRPLWTYIDPTVIDQFGDPECWAASSGPSTNNGPADELAFQQAQLDMTACLQADPPESLFVYDLYTTTRLTIVPKYWQTVPLGNNACCYDIQTFVPVFLDGVWTSRGPQWTCSGGMVDDAVGNFCKHEPGRTGAITVGPVGQRKVDSASAIVLSCEVLPELLDGGDASEKCKKVESGGTTIDIFLNLYLTR